MRPEEIVKFTIKSKEQLAILQILLLAGKPMTVNEIMKNCESYYSERIAKSENSNSRKAEFRRALNNKQDERTPGLVQDGFVIRIPNEKTNEDSYKITERGKQALTVSEVLGHIAGMAQKIFADDETANTFFAITEKQRLVPTFLLDMGVRRAPLYLKSLGDYDFDSDIRQDMEFLAYLKTNYPDIYQLDKAGKLTYEMANKISGKDFGDILARNFPKHGSSWLINLPGGPLDKVLSKTSQEYSIDAEKNMTFVRNMLKERAKEQ